MTSPFVIRGLFPTPKPCPKPADGAWIGFQIESGVQIDTVAGEVRGFQGLIRSIPADPRERSDQDSSEPFVVHLTDADVQGILAIVLSRAKADDVAGVYDDPAWNGAPIVMTVNGTPV